MLSRLGTHPRHRISLSRSLFVMSVAPLCSRPVPTALVLLRYALPYIHCWFYPSSVICMFLYFVFISKSLTIWLHSVWCNLISVRGMQKLACWALHSIFQCASLWSFLSVSEWPIKAVGLLHSLSGSGLDEGEQQKRAQIGNQLRDHWVRPQGSAH